MVNIIIQHGDSNSSGSAYAEYIHRCVQAIDTSRHRRQLHDYLDNFDFSLMEQHLLISYLHSMLPELERNTVEQTMGRRMSGSRYYFSSMSDEDLRTLFALLIQPRIVPLPSELKDCPLGLRLKLGGEADELVRRGGTYMEALGRSLGEEGDNNGESEEKESG